jgi:hypothetical protein
MAVRMYAGSFAAPEVVDKSVYGLFVVCQHHPLAATKIFSAIRLFHL